MIMMGDGFKVEVQTYNMKTKEIKTISDIECAELKVKCLEKDINIIADKIYKESL